MLLSLFRFCVFVPIPYLIRTLHNFTVTPHFLPMPFGILEHSLDYISVIYYRVLEIKDDLVIIALYILLSLVVELNRNNNSKLMETERPRHEEH